MSKHIKCPHCKNSIHLADNFHASKPTDEAINEIKQAIGQRLHGQRHGGQWLRMASGDTATAVDHTIPDGYEKITPLGTLGINELWVAGISGLIAGGVTAFIVALLIAPSLDSLATIDHRLPLATGLIVGAIFYFRELNKQNDNLRIVTRPDNAYFQLLQKLESATAVDHSDPEPQEQIIKIEVKNGNRRNYYDMPEGVTLADMRAIAYAIIVDNASLSRNGLSGILSQGQYKTFLEWLKQANMVQKDGAGYALNGAGRSMLRRFHNMPDTAEKQPETVV